MTMTKWERINQPKKVKPPRYHSVEVGRRQQDKSTKPKLKGGE